MDKGRLKEVQKSALFGGLVGTGVGLYTQMEKASTGLRRGLVVVLCGACLSAVHSYGTYMIDEHHGPPPSAN